MYIPLRVWLVSGKTKEGWHNAFSHGIGHPHPSFVGLLCFLQKEQSLQEAIYAKWEGGSIKEHSKLSVEREKRIHNIVINYDNRETLEYLRGIAYNFEFSLYFFTSFIKSIQIIYLRYIINNFYKTNCPCDELSATNRPFTLYYNNYYYYSQGWSTRGITYCIFTSTCNFSTRILH